MTELWLEEQWRTFARQFPVPITGEGSWNQMCGSSMFRFGSWLGWNSVPWKNISPAWGAGKSSAPLNTDYSKAPIGAFHFWEGTDGHTGIDLRGGGTHIGMVTLALAEFLGPRKNAIGIQSVAAYSAAKRGIVTYRGWATNYGGGTVNFAKYRPAPARPAPPAPPVEEPLMTDAQYNSIKAEFAPLTAKLHELYQVIREEGRNLRVYFNTDARLYAVGAPGYWWEFGNDIADAGERERFGKGTADQYRSRGFAQDSTHEQNDETWRYTRMLCLNDGASPESKRLIAMAATDTSAYVETIKAAIEKALEDGVEIDMDVLAAQTAEKVAEVLAQKLAA